jgi:uncharacterized lipoprotein YddW (UPF0748 family)
MKRLLKKIFTTFADGLVSFSRAFGRQAWLMFLFILGLTIAVFKPTAAFGAAQFNDTQGNWAQPCIEQLAQKQIIRGYTDGSFKPNASVTRAEFAAMLGNAFPKAAAVRTGGKFADVPTSHWASEAIRKAYQAGFLAGYPGGVFNPDEKIPRVQALVSLASGLKYVPVASTTETLNAAFSDVATIPEYSRSAIAAATEKQLVVNYPNARTLNPDRLATRADVAAFLCQATGTTGLISSQYIASAGTKASDPKKDELRGVWLTNIDSKALFSTEGVTDAIQRLQALNFNTVYPAIWNWGYSLYPSKVAERVVGKSVRLVTELDEDLDPNLGTQGRDMLKEMIEQAHKKGLRVIPWFEFGFKTPSYTDLAKRHPEWLTQRRDGTKTQIPEGVKPEKRKLHEVVWLNPFKPEVQQFIQDLVVEIVSNYDVDGIQFDDHFGLPAEFGYDDYTVQLYKKEHQGKAPPSDPQDAEWVRWRANKITEFLAKVFRAIKDRKEKVIVSVSPNPQRESYQFFLADWADWERRGLVEELVVQIYRDNFDTFVSLLEKPEMKAAKSHIPTGVGILTGLKEKPVPASQIKQQVEAVRQRGFAGVAFFFYETLWNNAPESSSQRQEAFRLLFPMPAKSPEVALVEEEFVS